MHVAVDGMVDEYRLSFYTFLLGLFTIHLAAIFYVWLVFRAWQVSFEHLPPSRKRNTPCSLVPSAQLPR
eukprot:scaffold70391_cov39-Tisochrysis_lutea.AAC.3